MKKFSFVLSLGLAVVSANAFGVRVANCPKKIAFEASDLKITKSLAATLAEEDSDVEEQIAAITAAHGTVSNAEELGRTFTLTRAASGRCQYGNTRDVEKIEIYSTGGEDKIYLQQVIGPRGIVARVYAKIESLSTRSVELTKEDAGLALGVPRYPYTSYTAGGSLLFVGKAKTVSVKVKTN